MDSKISVFHKLLHKNELLLKEKNNNASVIALFLLSF